MDNPNLVVRRVLGMERGVFATKSLKKGTLVAMFNGPSFRAKKCSLLPNVPPLYIRDHAIQYSNNKWIDSKGIGRYLNHSCEPNCGIKEKFTIIAMRDIKKGEQLTFDYDMTENSDWEMICKCKSAHCRGLIHGYRFLPASLKKKYRNYISTYLKSRK